MPIGTETPPASDLIERFSAIIADVLACVTDAALKAAGVPWPVRVLMAPLLRRWIVRRSSDFSALLAQARADRPSDSAAAGAVSLADQLPCADRQSGAKPGMQAVRFASGPGGRTISVHDADTSLTVALLADQRAAARDHGGTIMHARSCARAQRAVSRGPADVFSRRAGAAFSRAHFVSIC
jgi:hypothetical protein